MDNTEKYEFQDLYRFLFKTENCPYCHGSGIADEHNECGFCDERGKRELK